MDSIYVIQERFFQKLKRKEQKHKIIDQMWDFTTNSCRTKAKLGELEAIQKFDGDKFDVISDYQKFMHIR